MSIIFDSLIASTPTNYSQYHTTFFDNTSSGWGFVSHYANFWTTVVPEELFWLLVIIIPFYTIYNRTGNVVIPSVLYLFIGGVLGTVMPTFLGQLFYWFIIVGGAGLLFNMYIGRQG